MKNINLVPAVVAVSLSLVCNGLLFGCKTEVDSSAQLADAAVAPTSDSGAKARDVFEVNCATCHKQPGTAPVQFQILDFAALKAKKSANGAAFIDTASPDASVVLARMNDQAKPMPPSGVLPDEDREAVANWIAAGAPEPAPPTPNAAAEAERLAASVEKIKQTYETPLPIGHVVPFAKNWTPKALLEFSCAPCHSSSVKPPWYAKFDVTGTIKSDMERAVAVWEMGSGFPFNNQTGGTKTRNQLIGDLKLLHGALAANSMPPKIFLTAHPQAYLNTKYRSALMFWCDESVNSLMEK